MGLNSVEVKFCDVVVVSISRSNDIFHILQELVLFSSSSE